MPLASLVNVLLAEISLHMRLLFEAYIKASAGQVSGLFFFSFITERFSVVFLQGNAPIPRGGRVDSTSVEIPRS